MPGANKAKSPSPSETFCFGDGELLRCSGLTQRAESDLGFLVSKVRFHRQSIDEQCFGEKSRMFRDLFRDLDFIGDTKREVTNQAKKPVIPLHPAKSHKSRIFYMGGRGV